MPREWSDNPVFVRFVRYLIVSVATYGLDLAIVYALVQYLHAYYLFAIPVGYACEIVAMFFSNRAWTFHNDVRPWRIVFSTGINLTTLAFILVITYIQVQNFAIPYLVARTVAGIIAEFWSYYWDARLTFQVRPFQNS